VLQVSECIQPFLTIKEIHDFGRNLNSVSNLQLVLTSDNCTKYYGTIEPPNISDLPFCNRKKALVLMLNNAFINWLVSWNPAALLAFVGQTAYETLNNLISQYMTKPTFFLALTAPGKQSI
jgi:hypothetical protein